MGALRDRVRHDAVQPDARQQQRQQPEEAGQLGEEEFLRQRLVHLLGLSFDVEEWKVFIYLSNGGADGGGHHRGIDNRSYRESRHAERDLWKREIRDGRNITPRPQVSGVSGHAYNLDLPTVFGAAESEVFA